MIERESKRTRHDGTKVFIRDRFVVRCLDAVGKGRCGWERAVDTPEDAHKSAEDHYDEEHHDEFEVVPIIQIRTEFPRYQPSEPVKRARKKENDATAQAEAHRDWTAEHE